MKLFLVASLLRRGAQLERLSDGITLVALAYACTPLLGLPLPPLACAGAGLLVVLGLAHKYWALRVALDAELFMRIAQSGPTLAVETQALDEALHDLHLKPKSATPRDWPSRSQGALILLRRQALCFGLQTLLLLASLLTLPFTG
ncbi:hypothetical protein SJI00_18055 [Pseudomonas sp. RP23018S]|uniref:hypothetical protein n=1 Tax=Pseudomonas sp. RP23018S TaxID=3096037 RepID=UPI002ACA7A78|nr:hypothetical protein [Pseudomonas sp. RP23018S]MDZ5604675.1 hypothetical protein [Pseudomonas sp. RP23018S]